jgi:hypothetical protein
MRVGSDALRHGGPAPASGEAAGSSATDRAPSRTAGDSVWLILAVAAVIAIGIAFRFFVRSDLWADEVISVNIARLPLSGLREALRHDGAPPLYYVFLHFWMEVFGTGNAAARALSGVIGVVTLVPAWYAGARLDARRAAAGLQSPDSRFVAWASVLLLAASPFAIRYATEARMYALVILLVYVGYLALLRVFDRPSWGRLLVLAAVTAALVYTHYWAFALLAVVGAWLLWLGVRGRDDQRRPAWLALGALVVGALTFIPWLPTFVDQARHTGTPWGAPVSPVGSTAEAVKSFGGNTHAVGWALLLMVVLAVFARGIDRRHLEVDLWTQKGIRLEIGIGVATLAAGLVAARLSGTTFEARYAAVMFPLFLLVAAFGTTVFTSRAFRYVVIAVLVVGGFWGGTSNALRSRTQAFQIRNAIEANGQPGDLVVYCPDSVGTDVSRILRPGFDEVGMPGFTKPGRIDWTDYSDRVDAMSPPDVIKDLAQRAGGHSIWFVYTDGTQPIDTKCNQIADGLAILRPRLRPVEPDAFFFEHQGLYRFLPKPSR